MRIIPIRLSDEDVAFIDSCASSAGVARNRILSSLVSIFVHEMKTLHSSANPLSTYLMSAYMVLIIREFHKTHTAVIDTYCSPQEEI